MYPPVFSIAAADAGVRTALGTDPVRLFPFGSAPEGVTLPYAVWQTAGGAPENYITNTPDIDSFLVQVDVYAETAAAVRSAAEALRDALEPAANITSWRGESKDQKTGHYRYSFDINFLTSR